MADRTKIWIADTMKRLMVRQSLDKIRVTDICKEAEIERPTFYYHFKDKYDLVAWIFFHSAEQVDLTDAKQCAAGMNRMRNDFIFYKRLLRILRRIRYGNICWIILSGNIPKKQKNCSIPIHWNHSYPSVFVYTVTAVSA